MGKASFMSRRFSVSLKLILMEIGGNSDMPLINRLAAEFIGTLWLVLGGCGSAVLAAVFVGPNNYPLGIALVGVSLAFGLTVLTMAYAIGHISGCHLNPAVSVGLWAGGRFPASDVVPYIIAQVLGGLAGAAVIYLIATGKPGFDLVASGFAANGFDDHSPGKYGMNAALICEVVMTFMFLIVILGPSREQSLVGDGLALGLLVGQLGPRRTLVAQPLGVGPSC
jgi:aquaporin Z